MHKTPRRLQTTWFAVLALGIAVHGTAGVVSAQDVISRHEDKGKDYTLATKIHRRGGRIVLTAFTRTTFVDGKERRRRRTEVHVDADGKSRYETKLWCYHADPQMRGECKLFLDLEEMNAWWREEAGKYGVTPELGGEACGLDDATKTPDESFEKYAGIHWKTYTKPLRWHKHVMSPCTWFWAKEPIESDGRSLKAARCAYWEHPGPLPSFEKDWTGWANTVAMRTYTQPVDDAGDLLPGSRRYVDFRSQAPGILMEVVQEMDYSTPRPTIRSYWITHSISVHFKPTIVRGPEECLDYKVEIEEVTDGEPALQGQWIRRVVPPDGLIPKDEGTSDTPSAPTASSAPKTPVATAASPSEATVIEHGPTPGRASGAARPRRPRTTNTVVAPFNFQMKNGTGEWRWIEKAMADRVITDLYRCRQVQVVQRDAMQRAAEQMKWTPELMNSQDGLDTVRQQLRPEYLISGIYDVADDTLSMTAIIVDMETRQEMARCRVCGPVDQVLDLTRALSAEVLAWLLEGEAERILADLPAWTRSIPAARALYEGVDLYDQGRYAEAWLLFRQASKTDPAYAEATYWVAKMYYFMDRHDHARRGYEQFLYGAPNHPRVGEAVIECIDTFERADMPTESLLQLYERLEKQLAGDAPASSTEWEHFDLLLHADKDMAKHGMAGTMAFHLQSQSMSGPVISPRKACYLLRAKRENLLKHLDPFGESVGLNHGLYGQSMRGDEIPALKTRHLLVTGQSSGIFDKTRYRFDGTPRTYSCDVGGSNREKTDRYIANYPKWCTLVAAEGMVLRSVTVVAKTSTDAEGDLTIAVGHDLNGDAVAECTVPMSVARDKGATLTGFLPSYWLQLRITFRSTTLVEGFEVSARAARPTTGLGAIRTNCPSTADYLVKVDQDRASLGNGIVGFVPVGRHTVTFLPRGDHSAALYQPWETTVDVVEGKATQVTGPLSWKKESPFSSWQQTRLVGGDYTTPPSSWEDKITDSPALLLDDDCIRVVWSRDGDLWMAESFDGDTFSAPRRLALPVSAAWLEANARLLRDEAGRVLLLMKSTRDLLHEGRCYVSWSRDFEHWSGPAMTPLITGSLRSTACDRVGRLLAMNWNGTLSCSRDLIQWQRLGNHAGGGSSRRSLDSAAVLHRRDHRIEVVGLLRYGSPVTNFWLTRTISTEGTDWTEPELISRIPFPSGREYSLSAFHDGSGRTTVALFSEKPDSMQLCREKADGTWEVSPWFDGVAGSMADMAWHPRWGYVLAWNMGGISSAEKSYRTGPYVTRGESIDAMLRAAPHPATQERIAEEFFQLGRAYELNRSTPDDALRFYHKVVSEFPGTEAANKARGRINEIGK